jgi:hypothetical protein
LISETLSSGIKPANNSNLQSYETGKRKNLVVGLLNRHFAI